MHTHQETEGVDSRIEVPTALLPTPAAIATRTSPPPQPDQRYRRGDIWKVVSDPFSPSVGNELWSDRPAIIVSNNVLNARSGVAQVVYLTTSTRKRSSPTHIEIPTPDGGMSMALCEQIHTVDASRLTQRLGIVPEDRMRDLNAALAISLGIGRNPNTHAAFRKWEEHIKAYGIDIAKEIDALAEQTTDRRVEALTRALRLTTIERDAYQDLLEAGPARAAALRDVEAALRHTEQ